MELLIIGLDGLNWPLLEPLLARGWLPTLARLAATGVRGPLTSVLPTQSAAAWASFSTGQTPAGHGVFDFLQRLPDGTYRHAKPAPATTLWAVLNRAGRRVGVINFPVTYPPDPVEPFQIGGMLSLHEPSFTYPAALAADLATRLPDYRLDVEWQLYKGRPADLLADLTQMTDGRVAAVELLAARQTLDCLAVAYVSPDRALHPLWYLLDPSHPAYDARVAAALQPVWEAYWRHLDRAVERTLALATAESTVFVLSDHGFQSAVWQFRANEWLAGHGWYTAQPGRGRLAGWLRRLDSPWIQRQRRRLFKDISRHVGFMTPGGATDWRQTLAFCPWQTQQGIRLNLAGREPHGVVAPGAAAERLLDEIEQALRQATFAGLPVVGGVVRARDLAASLPALPDAAPFLADLPDLLFWPQPPFAANLQTPGLFSPTGWATGDHAYEGLFLAWGKHVDADTATLAAARLIDIAPTALYRLGVPVPETMHGRVLSELFTADFLSRTPQAPRAAALPAEVEASAHLTAAETADLQERLRGLGYL